MSKTATLTLAAAVLILVSGTTGAVAATVITGAQIKDGTVTGADIASGSVPGTDLKDGSVGSVDIKDGALRGADLLDGTVGALDLSADAVDGTRVADSSLTSADVANSALTGADLADGSITSADLGTSAVIGKNLSPAVTEVGSFATSIQSRDAPTVLSLACGSGIAINGGILTDGRAGVRVAFSAPTAPTETFRRDRWTLGIENTSGSGAPVTVYLVCLRHGS